MRSSCIGALVLGSMCSSIRTGPRPLQKLECFLQLDSVVLETTRRRMLLPHAFRDLEQVWSQAALTSAWLDAGRVGRREIGSAHAARGLVRFATH
eukprot:symbB.v1.2.037750.t3/scaffold5529.1/size26123/2